jgi:hypothetical protein
LGELGVRGVIIAKDGYDLKVLNGLYRKALSELVEELLWECRLNNLVSSSTIERSL